MTTLAIKDLSTDTEMDSKAMQEVSGGMHGFFPPSFNVLSPQLYNKVTPITGAASLPTVQGNYLNQVDNTNAANGHGIQFISNNKFASQSNSNMIHDVLNPHVG